MALPRVWGQVVSPVVLRAWELVARTGWLRPYRYLARLALSELLAGDHRLGTGSNLHW